MIKTRGRALCNKTGHFSFYFDIRNKEPRLEESKNKRIKQMNVITKKIRTQVRYQNNSIAGLLDLARQT